MICEEEIKIILSKNFTSLIQNYKANTVKPVLSRPHIKQTLSIKQTPPAWDPKQTLVRVPMVST